MEKVSLVNQAHSEKTPFFSNKSPSSWHGRGVEEITGCESCCIKFCQCFYNPAICCGVCSIICLSVGMIFGGLWLYPTEQVKGHKASIAFITLSVVCLFGGIIGGVIAKARAPVVPIRLSNGSLRVMYIAENGRLWAQANQQGQGAGLDWAHCCCP